MDMAQTQPHGVGMVLEKSYTPMDQLDTELFMENQMFLFGVMKKSFQKCKLAKMTISKHSEAHDARAVRGVGAGAVGGVGAGAVQGVGAGAV